MCSPAGTFNVATSLIDRGEYNNKMRMAKDLLDYKFDLRPNPICFQEGENFQGFSGPKSIPSYLIDIETYLKQAPVIQNDYLDDEMKSVGPPIMPKILQNKLYIPDCSEFIKTDYSPKMRRTDPRNTLPVDGTQRTDLISEGRKQTVLFMPGVDTRLQLKDAYKEFEKDKYKDVFGISKGLQGNLQVQGDIPCDSTSSLDCIHLFGPGAGKNSNLQNINVNGTLGEHLAVTDGSAPGQMAGQAYFGAPIQPIAPQVYSAATKEAVKNIDANMSLGDHISEKARKDGCNVTFTGYKNPCAK